MSDEAIITSSTNQIWAGSVPNPPDDPRPEPPPPPDDALPILPLPCPKCGAPGVCDDGWFVGCSNLDCTLPEMMLTDWQRLARAVALLRAVERLESALRHEVDAVGLYRNGWRIRGVYNWPGGAVADTDSAADALIALAAQLEARDE